MKRSEINEAIRTARKAFKEHGWILPPNPRWDVTDFGLDDFTKCGLTLVNLAEQPEYCEKIMYVGRNQVTPRHYHAAKKEDIICRWGRLAIEFPRRPAAVKLQVNGEWRRIPTGKLLVLRSGERVTLTRRIAHAFWALTPYAIVGEVSTANDDAHDNYFADRRVGRFSPIEEDERPLARLVSE